MRPKHPLRRLVLASLALAAFAGPAVGSGCSAGFAPISQVDGLRVLGVVADKPYAQPGDQVTFTMTYADGYIDPKDPNAVRKIQILWLGGCFDPPGDLYYGCYPQLAPIFANFDPKNPPPGVLGGGDTFTITLPDNIISSRPAPPEGMPYYGIAYVFFAACAGNIRPVAPEGTGAAGSFPLGCFDDTNNRLGADSFVPGYTQVYAFADGRINTNPVVKGVTVNGKPLPDGPGGAMAVQRCTVPENDRLGPQGGCGKRDVTQECEQYDFSIDVPKDVAEVDPDAKDMSGNMLHEGVWVDYFADQGSFDSPTRLVSDPTTGVLSATERGSRWTPPGDPGLATIWIVVHDARGGETVLQRYMDVQ
jgi:hypothetical protein